MGNAEAKKPEENARALKVSPRTIGQEEVRKENDNRKREVHSLGKWKKKRLDRDRIRGYTRDETDKRGNEL